MSGKSIELAGHADLLPGIELLQTDAAREVANRTQFKGGIGNHVYVNGYDLERVESAGLRDPRIVEVLLDHGWYAPSENPMEINWFRRGDATFAKHTIAEAILAVIAELDSGAAKPMAAKMVAKDA